MQQNSYFVARVNTSISDYAITNGGIIKLATWAI